ncbi:ring-cleaving dioxygenase [Paenibacillus amylolyticus]|nr:ring-cleaving dioxygenase [Paenibacillus amylolyticus]WFR65447.1 ring-cleaving dioxygenase [Paenibacillus amylolyticus]
MMFRTSGIHHITAFVDDAQKNVDFYAGVLGLRLVKKTINFDAPDVYHLYYGNEQGAPGTIITFFPQQNSRRGVIGSGQTGVTVYAVPVGSLPFWKERLASFDIPYENKTRFGEQYIRFFDKGGLLLELVEREGGQPSKWTFNGVTPEHAIKGFGGAVLFSHVPEKTMDVLVSKLGLEQVGEEDGILRLQASGDIGQIIDIQSTGIQRGIGGAGTVHHIAWRAKDYTEHEQIQQDLEQSGYHPTPVIDRQYFNAVYFREPGGILFELATDPPGFARDEPAERMGEKLMLPEWYEPQREQIEQLLPRIEVREWKGESKS